jgi:hypothetical protein
MTYYLVSWVVTSTVHAYPVVLFTGTEAACQLRRSQTNFPESLCIYAGEIPSAY